MFNPTRRLASAQQLTARCGKAGAPGERSRRCARCREHCLIRRVGVDIFFVEAAERLRFRAVGKTLITVVCRCPSSKSTAQVAVVRATSALFRRAKHIHSTGTSTGLHPTRAARCMSQQVLTERQVQNTLSNNNTSNTTNSNSKEGKAQQQPAKSLALARLQAQRVDRRRDPNNTTATATQQPNTLLSSSPLPLVCSQNATNKPRLRGLRITTTAGSGMQRQAPSSRPSSVRGSMDNLQQLQSPQLKQQPAPLLLAATTAAVQAPALSSNVRSAPLSKQPSPSRAVVRSQQAGGGLLLQVHGAGAASRQNQQQQQQHGDRRSSSSIRVTPVKQQAALCATGVRPAPRARGAVPAADAGAGGPSAGLLGCGAAWQELEAAVAGARAAPQPLGSNLQQRRQVQQSR